MGRRHFYREQNLFSGEILMPRKGGDQNPLFDKVLAYLDEMPLEALERWVAIRKDAKSYHTGGFAEWEFLEEVKPSRDPDLRSLYLMQVDITDLEGIATARRRQLRISTFIKEQL
jgi:hypothetical protein